MRSSASSWLRQVLQLPLQKLTTTTSPRCSEMRTFSPVRPRATRSGACWPTSSYRSAAEAGVANNGNTQPNASAAIRARVGAADFTNKQAITVDSTSRDTGQAKPDSTQYDAGNPRIAYLTMSTQLVVLVHKAGSAAHTPEMTRERRQHATARRLPLPRTDELARP